MTLLKEEEDPEVSSSSTFFVEQEQVNGYIRCLTTFDSNSEESTTVVSLETDDEIRNDSIEKNQALSQLRVIFDKYLECATLLDPHLESIVTSMSKYACLIIHKLHHQLRVNPSNQHTEDKCCCNIQVENLKRILSAIYAVAKVRGRKHIQRFLSHDACDVEPVLFILRYMEQQKDGEDIGFGRQAYQWESIYTLLLWLRMLSLVPFDLNTIDSTMENDSESSSTDRTLISSMIYTTKTHLNDTGPTREAAAWSLASLLSRPDLEEKELESFVLFSSDVMNRYLKGDKIVGTEEEVSIFQVMGVVLTLATIFKTGSRSNLMERHLKCIEKVWEQAILVADHASPKKDSSSLGGGGALMLRKLLVKFFARVGSSYLPPKVASWRYQRGKRSLLENLTSINTVKLGSIEEKNAPSMDDTHADFFIVPDQVEDSMAQLIHSLTDPATTVRWTCAKGIGRVTERLPAVCADDVLDALLDLCSDLEDDNAWHGTCLALAELARRGLLLPRRLDEVVPIVIKAIQYDLPRGQHSVGSHVRDSACYACWAFARAYSPSILKPFVLDLSKAIVIASLFDREINCRRAASASFQECVGRQGADNFLNGIAILTAADYFSLGNRVDAYTSVAFKIAEFDTYRRPIIDHLFEEKLFHWDVDIRILSSKSLQQLTPLEPMYFVETVLPYLVECATNDNLCVRHGAVHGIAEITMALSETEHSHIFYDSFVVASITGLVFDIERKRLYRGRGGEIMRSAVSLLIQRISQAKLQLSVKQQLSLLDILDTNLKHPNENIQTAAGSALYYLMRNYFPVGENGPSERLQKRVIQTYIEAVCTEDNPAVTRGFTLALGCLPSKLLSCDITTLDKVLVCLINSSNPSSLVGGQADAETRRNSIQSLIQICEEVGVGSTRKVASPCVALTKSQLVKVFHACFTAMDDYSTDRRGDVGSWTRLAAMTGLEKLCYLAVRSSNMPQNTAAVSLSHSCVTQMPSLTERFSKLEPISSQSVQHEDFNGLELECFFDDVICNRVIGTFLKQLSEKLDLVRNHAGNCIYRLLTSNEPRIPFINSRDLLKEALDIDGGNKNWANPEETYTLLMKAINIDTFFDYIIDGIVISVGGLTESVTKYSTKALLEYFRALKMANASVKISKIAFALIRLFEEQLKNQRVILPLLVTLDKLISHSCLDTLFKNETSKFAEKLATCVRKEAQNCQDINRVMAIVPVTLGILDCSDRKVVESTLLFLMRLLVHKFPRVRRHVAEQLYIKLVEDCSFLPFQDNCGIVIDILAQVKWDRELGPPANIREDRNKIANLLHIHLTERDKIGIGKKKDIKINDEFESYASLVQASGR
jgi:tubulin-specific chaperone D